MKIEQCAAAAGQPIEEFGNGQGFPYGNPVTVRPRSVRRQINPFWQFLIEFDWLLVALVVAGVPAQAATHSKGNVTLFVHGFGPDLPHVGWTPPNGSNPFGSLTLPNEIDCSGYWEDLPSSMRRQGYTGQFILVTWYQNASNCDVNLHNWGQYDESYSWVDVGAALSQYVYQSFTSKGIPVDIVSHSMGGMVTRSAIYWASGKAPPFYHGSILTAAKWSPPIDVGTAITAGSPHLGSNTAIVNICGNEASNQQICRETWPGSNSEIWINGLDSNHNVIHPEARNPQGKFGTQWINIAAKDTSLLHNPLLPCCENPISDGVIDTTSAISMTIPSSNKLIVPGDVSHLEFFLASKGSNDAGGANAIILGALEQDYSWASRNFIAPSWTLYNSGLSGGDRLISANGSYSLLQRDSDGNLVIYDNANRPLWSRGGSLIQHARSVMQDDGNLVTYSNYLPAVRGSGGAIWATNTAGNGLSYLGLMDDGNLTIVQTPDFAQHFPKQNITRPGGNYGGNVTWKAFTGLNSPLSSINPNSTPGGWCMEVPGGQISDNGHDPVTLAICNDSPQQNFVIVGQYGSIRALGRCLTNNGIGQPVTMEVCGQLHQNWVAELGVIRPADGSKSCVDVPGSRFVEGQPLAMASCNGSAEQNWVEPRIKNFSGSGKCLGGANPGVGNNNKAVLATCTGQVNQQWYTSGWWRNGGYRGAFQTKNNQCLEVPDQNFVGGQQLQFFQCNNDPAQDWIWFTDSTIRPAAQTQLCVDITQSNHNDGTAIELAPCNGTNAQQWDLPGGLSPNTPPAAPPPA